jgi:hypothetical protein
MLIRTLLDEVANLLRLIRPSQISRLPSTGTQLLSQVLANLVQMDRLLGVSNAKGFQRRRRPALSLLTGLEHGVFKVLTKFFGESAQNNYQVGGL